MVLIMCECNIYCNNYALYMDCKRWNSLNKEHIEADSPQYLIFILFGTASCYRPCNEDPLHRVQRRMISVDNFFVF